MHGLGRILPENICDSDETEKHTVLHKKKRCLPFFGECVRTGAKRSSICQRRDVGKGTAKERFPLLLACETLSRKDEKIRDLFCFDPSLFRKIGDGACKRMLRSPFQRIRCLKKLLLRNTVLGYDVCHAGGALGERPCLIERRDLYTTRHFHRFTRLEKDAILRAQTISYHDRDRRGKPQCTGAGDHEDGDGISQRLLRAASQYQMHREYEGSDANDRRHKDGGDLVCHAGDRRFRRSRLTHHADDLRKGRILTHARRFRLDVSIRIDRGRTHGIADPLIDRHRLTRQRRLIKCCRPRQDLPIDRDRFARLHQKDVPYSDLAHRETDLLSVSEEQRLLRRHPHERLQRIRCAPLRQSFEELAHGDECGDHRSRLEIELIMVERHDIHVRHTIGDEPCHSVEDVE